MSAPQVKASDERFTPRWILDLITDALGPIGYDPCAPKHNPTGAHMFTSLPEDGLETLWLAQCAYAEMATGEQRFVYVNPPFSNGNLLRWARKVAIEASRGCEIVVLTPVDPSTEWYAVLSDAANLALALKRRPAYDLPEGGAYKSVAKQPAMLWYFGARSKPLARAMAEHAHVWLPGVAL